MAKLILSYDLREQEARLSCNLKKTTRVYGQPGARSNVEIWMDLMWWIWFDIDVINLILETLTNWLAAKHWSGLRQQRSLIEWPEGRITRRALLMHYWFWNEGGAPCNHTCNCTEILSTEYVCRSVLTQNEESHSGEVQPKPVFSYCSVPVPLHAVCVLDYPAEWKGVGGQPAFVVVRIQYVYVYMYLVI